MTSATPAVVAGTKNRNVTKNLPSGRRVAGAARAVAGAAPAVAGAAPAVAGGDRAPPPVPGPPAPTPANGVEWKAIYPAGPDSTTLTTTVVTDAPVTQVVGSHNDPADFYGIALGVVAIVVAIGVTRAVFGRRGRAPGAEGPR